MAEDIFQEVSKCEIKNVQKAMKKDWPNHFIFHQYITVIDKYKNNKSHIFQRLYRYGAIEEGVYLIETRFNIQPEKLTLFFVYTISKDLSNLEKALLETCRIPWHSNRFMFELTMAKFTPTVGRTFAAKGLRAVVQHYTLLWLDPDVKVDMKNIPDDVFLESLSKTHALEVAKNWPSFSGWEYLVEKEISTYPGIGLFSKKDKTMLSSILSFHNGGIFMLYSAPEFRRKGYAEIVLRYIAIKMCQLGLIPFCTVFPDNMPSQNLVRKIGLSDFDKCDYIFPSTFVEGI